MSIPINLLQSQIALNKIEINELHFMEQCNKLDDVCAETRKGLQQIKRKIAKYALLQKAIKREIYEQTYDKRIEEDF